MCELLEEKNIIRLAECNFRIYKKRHSLLQKLLLSNIFVSICFGRHKGFYFGVSFISRMVSVSL